MRIFLFHLREASRIELCGRLHYDAYLLAHLIFRLHQKNRRVMGPPLDKPVAHDCRGDLQPA
jgi:hypothetical protein